MLRAGLRLPSLARPSPPLGILQTAGGREDHVPDVVGGGGVKDIAFPALVHSLARSLARSPGHPRSPAKDVGDKFAETGLPARARGWTRSLSTWDTTRVAWGRW